MLAQIVADTLGVPYDDIEVNAADTDEVPDSGPTVASRTCMIVGRLLERCAAGSSSTVSSRELLAAVWSPSVAADGTTPR
jgi:xanthine dehydrogenase molybdopterin-binding subunit B